MRLDKCDAYTAKETLRYRGEKNVHSSSKVRGKPERDKRRTKAPQ